MMRTIRSGCIMVAMVSVGAIELTRSNTDREDEKDKERGNEFWVVDKRVVW